MVSLFTVMIEELVHELCGGETGEPGKAKKNWEWVRSGSAGQGTGNWELRTGNCVVFLRPIRSCGEVLVR